MLLGFPPPPLSVLFLLTSSRSLYRFLNFVKHKDVYGRSAEQCSSASQCFPGAPTKGKRKGGREKRGPRKALGGSIPIRLCCNSPPLLAMPFHTSLNSPFGCAFPTFPLYLTPFHVSQHAMPSHASFCHSTSLNVNPLLHTPLLFL